MTESVSTEVQACNIEPHAPHAPEKFQTRITSSPVEQLHQDASEVSQGFLVLAARPDGGLSPLSTA